MNPTNSAATNFSRQSGERKFPNTVSDESLNDLNQIVLCTISFSQSRKRAGPTTKVSFEGIAFQGLGNFSRNENPCL